MTDLRQHLHDLVDRAPIAPLPLDTILERRPRLRRFTAASTVAVAAAVIATIVFAVPRGQDSPPQEHLGSDKRSFAVSPSEAVRGAHLEVTVKGLGDSAGEDVDLSVTTIDGSAEQGVASGRVAADGRLTIAFMMPGSLGQETQVVPGDYRLVFVVNDSRRLRFDHPVHVAAAKVGEKYAYLPTYGCLDYTWFDGRLWKLDGGNIDAPVQGATFALVGSDRATYAAPDGRAAEYRVADPASFDPEMFSCPGAGGIDPSAFAPPIQTTSTLGAPTELPVIASLKDSWLYNNGSVHHEYRLEGRANADTATPEAIAADPTSPAVHPGTYLSVSFNPELGQDAVIGEGKLRIPADPRYDNVETVDVNGAVGKLTTPKNGLGTIRLDWVDRDGNYHVVMVDRLQTSDGISGLSAKQILAIGRGIK